MSCWEWAGSCGVVGLLLLLVGLVGLVGVFGIGPANRPESPSSSGVAQGFCLIPVDSAREVAGVVC